MAYGKPSGNAIAGPDHKAGPGRPKGSRNRTSAQLREHFVEAFVKLGGTKALVAWGKTEPGEFYRVFSRLLPTETHTTSDVNLSGEVSINDARTALAEKVARVITAGEDSGSSVITVQ